MAAWVPTYLDLRAGAVIALLDDVLHVLLGAALAEATRARVPIANTIASGVGA